MEERSREFIFVEEDFNALRALVRRTAHELDLDNRVTFFGHRSDIPDLMRQLDVLVCASHVEPFGINVIEGMACELPVVGTRVARRARRATSPQRRRSMGRAGRERVKRLFSMERHVAEIVKLYRRAYRDERPVEPAVVDRHRSEARE